MAGLHRLSHGLAARPAVAAACLALAWSAPGGTAAAPADCLGIVEDSARLACFDREHARPAASAATVTTRPAPAVAPKAGDGPLSRAWGLDGGVASFTLQPYRSVYVLPLSVTDNVNPRPSSPAPGHSVGVDLPNRREEVKYQISARTLAWRGVVGETGDLWIAYTQSSRWQLYQPEISRPFRETNYEPELILNFATAYEVLGWRGRTAGVALNHQSNGRALPLSRSWNRLIAHVGFERGDWSVVLRPWLRLREGADQDDNPDIEDHIGRADLTVRRELAGGDLFSLRLRHSLRGGDRSRGSAELEWSFPLQGRLHGYAQFFSGYGESLIDYNTRQNRLGLGFALAGWN